MKTSLDVAGSKITLHWRKLHLWWFCGNIFFRCFLFELLNKADMQIRVILLKRIKMQIK